MNTLIRYFCSLFWIVVLCCFSYSELLIYMISESEQTFEEFFIESNSKLSMILVNVGVIGMLYVDNAITTFCTKRVSKHSSVLECCFVIGVILAIFMTVLSQMVVAKELDLNQWMKISYLFYIFIGCLIVYKANSLEIPHVSDDNAILPSRNC